MKRGSKSMARTAFETTKPPEGSKRWFVAQLDEKVRRIVKLNEPGCITCPETRPAELELSHFFKRGYEPTRFDVGSNENNHTQCRRCNARHNTDRVPYERWFRQRFGPAAEEIIQRLDERAHSGHQFSPVELEAMLKTLTDQLTALRQRRRAAAGLLAQPYDDADLPF
jgi:hypothetical protein